MASILTTNEIPAFQAVISSDDDRFSPFSGIWLRDLLLSSQQPHVIEPLSESVRCKFPGIILRRLHASRPVFKKAVKLDMQSTNTLLLVKHWALVAACNSSVFAWNGSTAAQQNEAWSRNDFFRELTSVLWARVPLTSDASLLWSDSHAAVAFYDHRLQRVDLESKKSLDCRSGSSSFAIFLSSPLWDSKAELESPKIETRQLPAIRWN